MKKKITVFTANRAEYGILKPLLTKLNNENSLKLHIIAGGSHLSKTFGYTINEIKKDKFKVHSLVESTLDNDSSISVSKSYALIILSLSEILKKIQPDFFLLLGDRYETSAAATAALIARIPIVHLQGGELTLGAIDDQFRHSITKMSHYHFCFANEYRKRVIQLGEDPKNVKNFGALNVESALKEKKMSKKILEKNLGFTLGKNNILVTFHPETLTSTSSKSQIKIILEALRYFKDCKIIFTKTNPDEDGRAINIEIDQYVKNNPNNCKSFASLGHKNYINCLRYFDLVIGNSSSGIIETPSFKIPTINLGIRQKGRVIAKNIINCPIEKKYIVKSIKLALSIKFKSSLSKLINPFYKKNTTNEMTKFLKNCSKLTTTKKFFYDK